METRKKGSSPSTLFSLLVLIVTASFFSLALDEDRTSYDGWKVLQVDLEMLGEDDGGNNTLSVLQDMEKPLYLEIFRTLKDKDVAEVAVSPEALEDLQQLQIGGQHISFSIIIDDLAEKVTVPSPESLKVLSAGDATYDRFMTIDEINAHLEDLPNQYPDKVILTQVGQSVENRPIYLVTLTSEVNSGTVKPIIFVDAGIHAREWISPAAGLYLIQKLLTISNFTDTLEWQIIPMLNPDGYSYTWTNDRLWRKNRADASGTCPGVDLNRNFGFHWGGAGTSSNPCSVAYRGSEAFSEPESRALRDAMAPVKDQIEAYVTLHSYGQYILHPWGYANNLDDHPNIDQLASIADGMAKAILKMKGPTYTVGGSAALMYPAAGASDDWASGVMNIPVAYTMELRDTGAAGFVLPEDQIFFAVNDVWLALRYLARQFVDGPTEKLQEASATPIAVSPEPQQEAE